LSEEDQKNAGIVDEKEPAKGASSKTKKSTADRVSEKVLRTDNLREDSEKLGVSSEEKSPDVTVLGESYSAGASKPEPIILSPEEMKHILSTRINDSGRKIRELEELEKQHRDYLYQKPVVRPTSMTGNLFTSTVSDASTSDFLYSDELSKLWKLHLDGAIDKKEYNRLKNAVLRQASI
jgi:hypothetical protein